MFNTTIDLCTRILAFLPNATSWTRNPNSFKKELKSVMFLLSLAVVVLNYTECFVCISGPMGFSFLCLCCVNISSL